MRTQSICLALVFGLLGSYAPAQWVQTNGPGGATVRALTMVGSNLIAGTAGGGVFFSTNKGTTWRAVNAGLTSLQVDYLFATNTILFASTWNGLFLTTDNGNTWNASKTGLANTSVRAMTVLGTRIFLAGSGGLFFSIDNGDSWSSFTIPSNNYVNAWAILGQRIYVAVRGGGVYRSADTGTTWTQVSTGLPSLSNTDVTSMVSDGMNLFAGTGPGVFPGLGGYGIFRSTNYGANWSAVPTGPGTSAITGLYLLGATIYAARADSTIIRTVNSGLSWSIVGGLPKIDVRSVAGDSLNTFVGSSAGVYVGSNGGNIWTYMSSGMINSQVQALFCNGNTVLAGTTPGGVFMTGDNGGSWIPANTGLLNTSVNDFGISGNRIYAATSSAGVFASTNNGATWNFAGNGIANKSVYSLAVGNGGLIAGTAGGVHISSDEGVTWKPANNGLTDSSVRAVACCRASLFAGTSSGKVFRSTNSGADWVAVNTWTYGNPVREIVVIDSTIFVATTGNGVFRSTNNGMNWSDVNTGILDPIVTSLAVSGGNVLVGTVLGYVHLSTNSGASWSLIASGLPFPKSINSLAVGESFLFAGTAGLGVWRRPLSEIITSLAASDTSTPSRYSLEQNFPNPFNPSTTISYELPTASTISLRIFNTLGQLVVTLLEEKKEAGYHQARWIANVPSGIYFCRLQAGAFVQTKKMILLR